MSPMQSPPDAISVSPYLMLTLRTEAEARAEIKASREHARRLFFNRKPPLRDAQYGNVLHVESWFK